MPIDPGLCRAGAVELETGGRTERLPADPDGAWGLTGEEVDAYRIEFDVVSAALAPPATRPSSGGRMRSTRPPCSRRSAGRRPPASPSSRPVDSRAGFVAGALERLTGPSDAA